MRVTKRRRFHSRAPLLEQEGWTRPTENVAKHPLKGADGVVAHRHSSGMHSDRWCVSDHPAAREQKHSLASSPPVPGGELARPNRFHNFGQFYLREGGESVVLPTCSVRTNQRQFIHTFARVASNTKTRHGLPNRRIGSSLLNYSLRSLCCLLDQRSDGLWLRHIHGVAAFDLDHRRVGAF